MRTDQKFVLFILMIFLSVFTGRSQKMDALEGRWNLSISKDGKELPSWLEITHSGNSTLVGRFVYAFGSARPISELKVTDGEFSFSIPPQWEPAGQDMQFKGVLADGSLKGEMIYTDGQRYEWTGKKAPTLPYQKDTIFGETIALFNGKNLEGWHAEGENQWMVEHGILKSPKSGSNLVSNEKFTDFRLQVSFRYPKGSNSGLYLRGRYEVQIADNAGMEPSSVLFGGVYGFLTPNEMVAKGENEWQTFDITLVGRRVTVVANGVTIISEQNIPGITGGALDNEEATPGPILIQGDHGPIEFKKIELTPIKS